MVERINYLEEALKIRQGGGAVALATVVRAEKPTSARPGDRAIITPDGGFHGWVGGSCAQPTVLREALTALRDGAPRYVRLTPPEKRGAAPQDGVVEVPLTCISGGTLEVFIEPMLPRPQLIAIGHLPVIQSLLRLASALDFATVLAGLELDAGADAGAELVLNDLDFPQIQVGRDAYIVVASHGNYDEVALDWALRTDARYVSLVTSRKRGEDVVSHLRASGMPEANLMKLKYPAGLDIGAQTPEEISLSILAEIIEARRRPPPGRTTDAIPILDIYKPVEAIDPVCGMTVDVAKARFTSEYSGTTYYFCCAGCQATFEREPERFVAVGSL